MWVYESKVKLAFTHPGAGFLQSQTRQRLLLVLNMRSSAEFLRGIESCIIHSSTLVSHVGYDEGEENK